MSQALSNARATASCRFGVPNAQPEYRIGVRRRLLRARISEPNCGVGERIGVRVRSRAYSDSGYGMLGGERS